VTIDRRVIPNKNDSAAMMMIHKIRDGCSDNTIDHFCNLFQAYETKEFYPSSNSSKRKLKREYEQLETEYSICNTCGLCIKTKSLKTELCQQCKQKYSHQCFLSSIKAQLQQIKKQHGLYQLLKHTKSFSGRS
ncbi:unnamed protein product, partial [Didymodactylos carnosus]